MRQFMDDAETRDSTINANFLNKYKHVGFKEEDHKFKNTQHTWAHLLSQNLLIKHKAQCMTEFEEYEALL